MEIPWPVYNHSQNVWLGDPWVFLRPFQEVHKSKTIFIIILKILFVFPTHILLLVYSGVVERLHDV